VQERNENKGEFSRKKLAGKRALELGAGLGLAGMGKRRCKSLVFYFHLTCILQKKLRI
jgi:hypothetical protein